MYIHTSKNFRSQSMTVRTINTLVIDVEEEKKISDGYETPVCRICLQEEIDMSALISPCRCCGSSKYVHVECLNEWRRMSQNPTALTQCEICATTYQVKQMTYHYFHNWCIQIRYNVWAIFIYHQLMSIIFTLVYLSTQPIRFSQSPYDSSTTHTNNKNTKFQTTEDVMYSAYMIYLYNLVIPLFPMFLYTAYVFTRYAKNKGEVCSNLCRGGVQRFFSAAFCAICTYIFIPDLSFVSILLLTWTIETYMMSVFENIEKVNRRYPQEIILDIP